MNGRLNPACLCEWCIYVYMHLHVYGHISVINHAVVSNYLSFRTNVLKWNRRHLCWTSSLVRCLQGSLQPAKVLHPHSRALLSSQAPTETAALWCVIAAPPGAYLASWPSHVHKCTCMYVKTRGWNWVSSVALWIWLALSPRC